MDKNYKSIGERIIDNGYFMRNDRLAGKDDGRYNLNNILESFQNIKLPEKMSDEDRGSLSSVEEIFQEDSPYTEDAFGSSEGFTLSPLTMIRRYLAEKELKRKKKGLANGGMTNMLGTGGITGNKTYHQYHDQFVPMDSESMGYMNGGGIGTMMQPRMNFARGGGADYFEPLGYVEDTSLEVEDSTPNNSGFMITAADALPDQTGTIKAAPKIMDNAGVTTITNSGINNFERPYNMRDVAGESLPFNIENLGNPTNDKRVVSEELGMTGYGKPNIRQVAGESNINRFSNTVAPTPSTPEIYQDLIMNPEYMPNRLQNIERNVAIDNMDFEEIPGFNFIDAPTSLKSRLNNLEYINNPNKGIIDNMILSRGNPEKSLFNKTKNMFSNVKDGIVNTSQRFKEGASKFPSLIVQAANFRNPLNPKASNYNPNLVGQLNALDGMNGMLVNNANSGLLQYGPNSVLSGQNAISGFGTNDYLEQLEKKQAYFDKRIAANKKYNKDTYAATLAEIQAEKDRQAAIAAAATAAANNNNQGGGGGDGRYGIGSDGQKSYDSGQGFGINATTGGPVSNRTGRGRTDYADGGIVSLKI